MKKAIVFVAILCGISFATVSYADGNPVKKVVKGVEKVVEATGETIGNLVEDAGTLVGSTPMECTIRLKKTTVDMHLIIGFGFGVGDGSFICQSKIPGSQPVEVSVDAFTFSPIGVGAGIFWESEEIKLIGTGSADKICAAFMAQLKAKAALGPWGKEVSLAAVGAVGNGVDILAGYGKGDVKGFGASATVDFTIIVNNTPMVLQPVTAVIDGVNAVGDKLFPTPPPANN